MDEADLKAAARKDGRLFHYGQAKTYTLDEPRRPADPLVSLRERTGEYSIPRPFVASLPNVDLRGTYPVATKDAKLVVEPTCEVHEILANGYYTTTRPGRAVRRNSDLEIDEACLLFNSQSSNYFHWMVEHLSRLEGIVEYERRTGSRPSIIVPPDMTAFQKESLRLLGYDENDWLPWNSFSATVDTLVIPSVRREYDDGIAAPASIEWLRSDMISSAMPNESNQLDGSLLYVSRENASRRRVSNEEEILEMLNSYGFEKVLPGELSQEQAVETFNRAEIIAGPHGAGLTDIIFSEDCAIIELLPNDTYSWAYYVLAQQLDFEYCYLLGEDSEPGTDFSVPVGALEALVQEGIS
jgi:capsular polysaccharide biosynthesis protein